MSGFSRKACNARKRCIMMHKSILDPNQMHYMGIGGDHNKKNIVVSKHLLQTKIRRKRGTHLKEEYSHSMVLWKSENLNQWAPVAHSHRLRWLVVHTISGFQQICKKTLICFCTKSPKRRIIKLFSKSCLKIVFWQCQFVTIHNTSGFLLSSLDFRYLRFYPEST